MLSARVCKHDFIWYRQASASSNLVSSGNISSRVLYHSAQHSKKYLNIWGVTPQGKAGPRHVSFSYSHGIERTTDVLGSFTYLYHPLLLNHSCFLLQFRE